MQTPNEIIRVQIMRADKLWAARLAVDPEDMFRGRSCAEVLGRLVIHRADLFGVCVAVYAGDGKRHVPTSEPVGGSFRPELIADIIGSKALPPLWTVGQWGREGYFTVPHPRHVKPAGGEKGQE